MSPRKSVKTPENTEVKSPAKTPAKGRARISETSESKPAPKRGRPKSVAKTEVETLEIPAAKEIRNARTPRSSKTTEVKAPLPKPPEPIEVPPAKSLTGSVIGTEGLTPQVQATLVAIREGRAVELIFSDADANPPRTFEPRQLIFDVFTRAWFVWGWDRRYNAERHHRLDLLSEVNPVEGLGRSAQAPFKEGTPPNQIGGWLGGEPIPVKAVLLKQWIYAVKQAPAPFPEFRMEDLEEGKAQVSFTATDLRAIARWCMQFGDGIQVLEPQRLIDRIKQVGITWAGKPVQPSAHPIPRPHQPQPHSQAAPEPRSPEPRSDARPARPEARPEARPDRGHKRDQPRHEGPRDTKNRQEHREHPEPREHREPREFREDNDSETPKPKPGKIEIRIDRL